MRGTRPSEKQLRQLLLQQMITELGYPAALIGVEKQLRALTARRFAPLEVPNRRVDIVCFAKEGAMLQPLLLIECKRDHGRQQRAWRQLLGYNYYVAASCVALVAPQRATIAIAGRIAFFSRLPPYSTLLALQRPASSG